jgi:hypothetical protein
MKQAFQVFLLSSISSQAAVVWQPAPNAVSSAAWDVWTYAPPLTQIGSGSQGPAQQTTGPFVVTSDVVTNVINSYEFPGGLGTNPDTYYFHTGGATWTGSVDLSGDVTHVRVSYSLLGFGGAPAEDFPMTPMIPGSMALGSGQYSSDDGTILGTVFYHDFALSGPQNLIETTFGDVVFPGFPGSFRSVDGIQIEVFDATPIPEPSANLFLLAGVLYSIRRRRQDSLLFGKGES